MAAIGKLILIFNYISQKLTENCMSPNEYFLKANRIISSLSGKYSYYLSILRRNILCTLT